MKILLKDEEREKIISFLYEVEEDYSEERGNEIKADLLYLILNPNEDLYKNQLRTEAEKFWYNSNLYRNTKTRNNKRNRQQRYEKRKGGI